MGGGLSCVLGSHYVWFLVQCGGFTVFCDFKFPVLLIAVNQILDFKSDARFNFLVLAHSEQFLEC